MLDGLKIGGLRPEHGVRALAAVKAKGAVAGFVQMDERQGGLIHIRQTQAADIHLFLSEGIH